MTRTCQSCSRAWQTRQNSFSVLPKAKSNSCMPSNTIAFLGPEGTFAHLAAERRFGKRDNYVAIPTIKNVFDYVVEDQGRLGIVPIENSSGGTILPTVELLTSRFHPLYVRESLSINVRLALWEPTKNPSRLFILTLHLCITVRAGWLRISQRLNCARRPARRWQ